MTVYDIFYDITLTLVHFSIENHYQGSLTVAILPLAVNSPRPNGKIATRGKIANS